MTDLELKLEDAIHVGHVVPIVFDSAEQLPGHVVSTPYWGDTELWTGVYLAGQAMRYRVAQEHLRKGPNAHASERAQEQHDTAFWTGQRDAAQARVRTVLEAFHRDINIAEDWDEELRVPAVNTQDPTGPHTADFGGGIVHGQRGMITRGCTPVGLGPLGINPPSTDPANPINDHANHVYEITWTHGDGNRYHCETSPSRDTYAGVTFGLLTTYDLVDDAALRAVIRQDLLAMADFLVKYGWTFPRPNGYVATGNDENGFVSPLMPHVPSARLNIVNAARHVAEAPVDKAKWDLLWAEELASQGPLLGIEKEINSAQPNEGYFKFNLDHLTGFNLLRTTSGAERDLLARGFAVMDKTTRDEGNAHFEALTFGLTGEPGRRDAAVGHLFEWLQYRAATAGGAPVRNSDRCGRDLSCVQKDRADITLNPAPPVTWYPGDPSRLGDRRAEHPLPVAQRPPGDFLWQEPPTKLDGQQPANAREPGIDFLTPYWTVRYFTEVAPPQLLPFPEWVGPAHS
ncbi:MAG: hypothetical protein JWN77_3219 [Frankiales bacterium]|jgi:hypothetical protein|nr:hypothetical protein [Frankiales bacterium]